MTKAKPIKCVTALLFFFFLACGEERKIDRLFDRAEALMYTCPDSAYSLLDSVRGKEFASDADRARFSLLYTQAQTKVHDGNKSEERVRFASDYYDRYGTVREKCLSSFYLGFVQADKHRYKQAMYSYMKAESYLPELDDDYLKGLLYGRMGELYRSYYDAHKALEEYTKSLMFFKKANRHANVNFVMSDIAELYSYLQDYPKSIDYYEQAIRLARKLKDTVFVQDCLTGLFIACENGGLYGRADSAYERMSPSYKYLNLPDYQSSVSVAHMYARKNQADSVHAYLKQAWHLAEDKTDSAVIYFREYLIYEMSGDISKAYKALVNYGFKERPLIRQRLSQPILTYQKEYFRSQAELSNLQSRYEREKSNRKVFVAFLIVFAAAYWTFRLHMKKKREIASYLCRLENLVCVLNEKEIELGESKKRINEISYIQSDMQDRLNNKDAELTDMKRHLQDIENCQWQLQQKVYEVFRRNSSRINELYSAYITDESSGQCGNSASYRALKSLMNKLSDNKDVFRLLEAEINECFGGIMKKVRQGFPKFKEEDFILLCYCLAGFSRQSIGAFMGKDTDYVSMRKSRLKNRIRNSNFSDKDILIEYL